MINWINKKRNKKGFTLIELIVVIAILGILSALAIPRLTGTRDTANRSAVRANLRTIESALTIAEAEGKTGITAIGPKATAGTLTQLGYLAEVPVGPDSTEYGIDANGRATVTFKTTKLYGFMTTASTPVTVVKDTVYTLSDLGN